MGGGINKINIGIKGNTFHVFREVISPANMLHQMGLTRGRVDEVLVAIGVRARDPRPVFVSQSHHGCVRRFFFCCLLLFIVIVFAGGIFLTERVNELKPHITQKKV